MKQYNVITIFPTMFDNSGGLGVFGKGVVSKAIESGIISVNAIDLREYAEGKHRVTDDYQYGGGVGLVMKPEPIIRAVKAVKEAAPTRVVLLDPRGEKFTQRTAERLSQYDNITFICGRYEGIDERVRDSVVDEAVSIGDFILTGGELAAMMMIDAVSRLVPGVLGDETSSEEESFSAAGGLEYPHYTRPPEYEGMKVPDVLISGNHADILKWRATQSLIHTRRHRPDLLPFEALDDDLKKEVYDATAIPTGRKLNLFVALMHYPMTDKQGNLVTTSVTNMDLHDISRSSATYGVKKYYVVTPLKSQREIAQRVIDHWMTGHGSTYNSNRKEAFSQTLLCDSVLFAVQDIHKMYGRAPVVVATTAKESLATVSAKTLGDVAETDPVLLLFGTGWGFVPEIFDIVHHVLEPIAGAGDFNHLSVRSAVAILLDRITRIK